MMDKEKFLASGLVEQYVLGLTSPEESKEVERYAQAFPDIQHEIDSLRDALEQYAKQHAIPPPGDLKGKIISEIDGIQQERVRSSNGSHLKVASSRKTFNAFSIVASIFAVGFSLLSLFLYQKQINQKRSLDRVEASFATYREQCEAQRNDQKKVDQLFAFVSANTTTPVQLRGTSLNPEARVVVYWNTEERNAYLNIQHLPTPPKGKQYQIWADVEGEMKNLGLIASNNLALQTVNFIDNAESLNITLEPEGGSEHPTVELLYLNGKV